MKLTTLCASVAVSLASSVGAQPDARALLGAYEQNQQSVAVCSFKASEDAEFRSSERQGFVVWQYNEYIVHRDDPRHRLEIASWHLERKDQPPGDVEPYRTTYLSDGERWYEYYDVKGAPASSNYMMVVSIPETYRRSLAIAYVGAPLDGVFFGESEDVAAVVRDAPVLTVDPARQPVDGHPCWVINAENEGGRYRLWVDPARGHSIVRAEVTKGADDLYYGVPLSDPKHADQRGAQPVHFSFRLTDVSLQRVGDAWFAVSGTLEREMRNSAGTQTTLRIRHVRDNIRIKPDFDATRTFVPDFPDGTRVPMTDDPSGVRWVWKQGDVHPAMAEVTASSRDAAVNELRQTTAPAASTAPTDAGPAGRDGASSVRLGATALAVFALVGVLVGVILLFARFRARR